MNKLLRTLAKIYGSSPRLRRWTVGPLAIILQGLRIDRETLKLRMGATWHSTTDNADQSPSPEVPDSLRVDFRELVRPYLQPETRLALLTKPTTRDARMFERACTDLGITHKIIDIEGSAFLDEIIEFAPIVCFARPSHDSAQQRTMHFERIQAVTNLTEVTLYPTLRELSVYESKLSLSYFLRANAIPHPTTWAFFSKTEALTFVAEAEYPLVFKITSGSGASGVEFVHTSKQAEELVKLMFDKTYYGRQAIDPRAGDYGYVFFQQFVPDSREFRIIKLGHKWFGHEKHKMPEQQFFSGSGHNLWTAPPMELLDFCEDIASKHEFTSMCFDILVTASGDFLVNELQTWFGSFNDSQMYVEGVPGCYMRGQDGTWTFVPGNFNVFASNSLRILHALETVSVQHENS